MAITQDFPDLAAALNAESYEYLRDNYPTIADALQSEVKRGGQPDAIRRFVQRHAGRDEIARRCEQAASWLMSGEGG